MEPVIIGNATLYCGDCRDVLPSLPQVDAVITSPPYDELRTYGGHGFDYKLVIPAIVPILSDGAVCVWVVGDSTTDGGESLTSARQAILFQELGLKCWDTMIYEKNGPSYPAKDKYYQTFEYMFVFSNGKPKTINLLDDRPNKWFGQKWGKTRTRRKPDGSLQETPWYKEEGSEFGVRFNIWRYNTGHGYEDPLAFEHPAVMPLQLAKDHIESWTAPGDTVLDVCMGGGTTGVGCVDLNRKFVGIEIEPKYFDIACKRIEQAQAQQRLFA